MDRIINEVVFGTISIVTLIGNMLVAVLFLRRRDWLKKTHTRLLLALAIQNVVTAITLLVLPGFVLSGDAYELPTNPKLGDLYCKLVFSWYVPFALSIVSIYTCLMLAIDRWFAVWKPLAYKRFCSSAKVSAIMLFLPWVAGFVCEIGTAVNFQSLRKDDGSYTCKWIEVDRSPKTTTIAVFLFIGKGFLPATLMVAAYARMMITLKQSSSRISPTAAWLANSTTSSTRLGHTAQSRSYLSMKRIMRTACTASAIVVFCWLPDQIYYCLFELNYIEMNNSIHNGLHILAFLNTCLNPFLYTFSNKQYKEEFKKILCCMSHRCFPDADRNSGETIT